MRYLLIGLLLLSTTLFANVGKVAAIKGEVTLDRDSSSINVVKGTILEKKDKITTGEDGRLQIVFNDKTVISIGKNSDFSISEYFYDEAQPSKVEASFLSTKGILKTITGKIGKLNPDKFKLNTKSAAIGIRGTIYFVEAQPGKPEIYACTQGVITVKTPDGEVDVPAGYQVVVEAGKPPRVSPMPEGKKQELEKSSGASDNESESGENAQSVEKEKATLPGTTTDDGTPPEDTPPTGELVRITDDTKKVADDSQDEVVDTSFTDGVTYTSYAADVQGDGSPKNATYDVFHTSLVYLNGGAAYGGYQNTDGTIASRPEFTVTNGLLSGDSTVFFKDYYGNVVELTTAGVQESSTISFTGTDSIQLPNPFTTYKGVIGITEYEHEGKYGVDDYVNYNTLNIYADSKQEFFYVYEITNEYSGFDGESSYSNSYIENNYLIFGTKSAYNSLPTSGVSHYSKGMFTSSTSASSYESSEDSDSHSYSSTYSYMTDVKDYNVDSMSYTAGDFTGEIDQFTRINWANKNLLYYYLNISDSTVKIDIGKVVDQDGDAAVTFNAYTNYSSSSTLQSSEIFLFGSEYQAIGGIDTMVNYEGITYEDPYVKFRADTLSTDSATPTGTLELNGFASSESLGTPIGSTSANLNSLTLSTDRSTTLSGSISCANSAMALTFGGALGEVAAYITDNTFASLGFSGVTKTSGSNTDEGWIIAVDTDLYDTTTNTQTPGITWGMWGVKSDISADTINMDFWVAGVDRVENITSTLGSDFTGTYIGNVMGRVTIGSIINKLNPIESTIELGFDFGAGTVDTTVNAVTTSGTTVNTITDNMSLINPSSGELTSIDPITGNIYQGSGSNGTLQGSFYNNGATTAGGIDITDGTNTINGVYKAIKQ